MEENVGIKENLRASLPGLLKGCVHASVYGGVSWCLSHRDVSLIETQCPCVSAALCCGHPG